MDVGSCRSGEGDSPSAGGVCAALSTSVGSRGMGQAGTAKAVWGRAAAEPFTPPHYTTLCCLFTIFCQFGHLCATLGTAGAMRFHVLWNMTTGMPVTIIFMHL